MTKPRIEVELRSFLTEEQFKRLQVRFREEGEYLGKDEQETHYLDAPGDVRIQRGTQSAKIWMKSGKLHDTAREEHEIPVAREDFDKLVGLFCALKIETKVKWFRTRHTFDWQGMRVMLDSTRGYGYIIELEKMVEEHEHEQEAALEELRDKLESLGIPLTTRKEFDRKYAEYCVDWKRNVGAE